MARTVLSNDQRRQQVVSAALAAAKLSYSAHWRDRSRPDEALKYARVWARQVTQASFAISADQLRQGINKGLIQHIRDNEVASQVLQQRIGMNRTAFANAHHRAAQAAQSATLLAYQANVESRKRQSGPYRGDDPRNPRYPGKLGNALSSQAFVSANSNGVVFGNVAILDAAMGGSRNAFWRRLNFGAGPGAGKMAGQGHLGGKSSIAAALLPVEAGARAGTMLDTTPGPAFSMPRGFWLKGSKHGPAQPPSGVTTDQFYPYSDKIQKRLQGGVTPGSGGSFVAAQTANHPGFMKNKDGMVTGPYSKFRGRSQVMELRHRQDNRFSVYAEKVGNKILMRGGNYSKASDPILGLSIQGRHFIEAGWFRLVDELGREYDELIFGNSRYSFMNQIKRANGKPGLGSVQSTIINVPGYDELKAMILPL